jgi:hypothetical protein
MSRWIKRITGLFAAITTVALMGTGVTTRAQGFGGELLFPDLDILSSVHCLNVNGQWEVRIEVKNRGDIDAPACNLQMKQHTGNFSQFGLMRVESIYLRNVAVPALNRNVTTTLIINMGSTYPTGQWAELKVDSGNVVVEKSELNNGHNHYF